MKTVATLLVLAVAGCGQIHNSSQKISKVSFTRADTDDGDYTNEPAPNFHKVTSKVFRSGHLRVESVPLLKSSGIRTILSLEDYLHFPNQARIDRAWAEKNGFKFIHFPLTWVKTGPSVREIDTALGYIINTTNQPILVHCQGGSDRTGIVIAAYRMRYQKWKYNDAVAELRKYDHNEMYWGWDPILHHYEPGH